MYERALSGMMPDGSARSRVTFTILSHCSVPVLPKNPTQVEHSAGRDKPAQSLTAQGLRAASAADHATLLFRVTLRMSLAGHSASVRLSTQENPARNTTCLLQFWVSLLLEAFRYREYLLKLWLLIKHSYCQVIGPCAEIRLIFTNCQ